MKFNLSVLSFSLAMCMLLTACNDDDDFDDNNVDVPPPSGTTDFVTFDLGGAIEGSRSGISIAINDITANGSLFTFEHMKPILELTPGWKLTILYNGGDTLQIVPGTYTIGNTQAFEDGEADFTAAYFDEHGDELEAWNPFGTVNGTLIVSEVVDNYISGTFEIDFENDPHGALTVSNGDFRSRYTVNYH